MDIYVVQLGDTIESIASKYGVTAAKLIQDNDIKYPNRLVPGETIVVVYPKQTYTVKNGDTLESIAHTHGVSVNELLRNNPQVSDMEYIYPGQELVISFNQNGEIRTHGYTNPFIDRSTLRKTLPYLTYLTIFNYRTSKNGEVVKEGDASDIIQLAKEYGVIPLMLMTTLTVQGEVDLELTYEVLINEEIQNKLFDNVIRTIKENGYYGVNISAQYISESNQSYFNKYTSNLSERLRQEGYLTMISINPKIDTIDNKVTYEAIDYRSIGASVDTALFLQYKWGYNLGPPSPVSSIYSFNVFLDYALTQIPSDKIFASIPTLGYDWELPYITGFSRTSSLSLDSVMQLARIYNVIIQFDEISQTPHFQYEDQSDKAKHEVWFINAITVESLMKMILEKNIAGAGIWNIMTYYTQLWLVINSQYKIIQYLPGF